MQKAPTATVGTVWGILPQKNVKICVEQYGGISAKIYVKLQLYIKALFYSDYKCILLKLTKKATIFVVETGEKIFVFTLTLQSSRIEKLLAQ